MLFRRKWLVHNFPSQDPHSTQSEVAHPATPMGSVFDGITVQDDSLDRSAGPAREGVVKFDAVSGVWGINHWI